MRCMATPFKTGSRTAPGQLLVSLRCTLRFLICSTCNIIHWKLKKLLFIKSSRQKCILCPFALTTSNGSHSQGSNQFSMHYPGCNAFQSRSKCIWWYILCIAMHWSTQCRRETRIWASAVLSWNATGCHLVQLRWSSFLADRALPHLFKLASPTKVGLETGPHGGKAM